MKSIPLLFALLLFADLATAQSIEVLIIKRVDDVPLSKAIAEIEEIGAALWAFEVTVEPALRDKRVTLDLDHTMIGALKAIAEAAGAHLWKLGEGKYAVRAKPPPASKRPPRKELVNSLELGEDPGEGEEEEEEEEEPLPPLPEWQQKINKALEETPFSGSFKKTHVEKILKDMASQAKVPLHLDPDVLRTRTRKELTVDYEHPLEDPTVDEALTGFCGFHDVGPNLRWGVIFVTTLERMLALPDDVFIQPPTGLPPETEKALTETRVSEKLKRNSLKKAVANLAAVGGLEIDVDASAVKLCRKRRFTVEFKERRLVDALSILLIPEGLGLAWAEGRLVVRAR